MLLHCSCCWPQPIAGEPFPGSKTGEPRHVELMRAAFKLKDPPEAMWALSRRALSHEQCGAMQPSRALDSSLPSTSVHVGACRPEV